MKTTLSLKIKLSQKKCKKLIKIITIAKKVRRIRRINKNSAMLMLKKNMLALKKINLGGR